MPSTAPPWCVRCCWPASGAALASLEHLVGLQAQTTHTWYTALWCRLESFQPEALSEALTDGRVVRIALMRNTIHLVTADDAVALRAVLQPTIERLTRGTFGKHLAGSISMSWRRSSSSP